MDNFLINTGGAIKSLEVKGDFVTVGDYGVLWGDAANPDLGGDWFTPSTNFGASKGVGVNTMLHHGIPLTPALKAYSDILLPPTVKADADDHGLLVATILDRRDAYERKLYELTEEGAMSWSSGAITRAVRRRDGVKCGEITQWPIFEFSFTPTPAEFRLTGIRNLDEAKSAPEDWLGNVSYAKAVRVLSDLAPREEIKSEEKKAGPFKFCSTQCNLHEGDAKTVLDWGKTNIPDDVLADDGREDEPHVTVLFGLNDDNVEEVKSRVAKFGRVEVKVGEIDCFEAPDYDVVMLRVDSSDLLRLNKTLATLDHTSTHSKYQPHITLAYVESGKGAQFKGEGPLFGKTLMFDGFLFSDKNGEKIPVSTIGETFEDETKAATEWQVNESFVFGELIRDACNRLCWEVVPQTLSPDSEPMQIGTSTLVPATQAEKLAYLQSQLDGFTGMINKMVRMVLELRAEESPEEAAKSLRNEAEAPGEMFSNMTFGSHSEKIVAAIAEYQERVEDLIELRAGSRKAGRVLSKANRERLTGYHSRLKELEDEMADLLEAHAPDDVANAADTLIAELDAPGVAEKKSLEDELADLELAEMERRFHESAPTELIAAAD